MQEIYTNAIVHKGKILYRGRREDGKRIEEKLNYEPYLFLPAKNKTPYQTLQGNYVTRKDFSSISAARQFTRDHQDITGFDYFGLTNYEYCFINDKFPGKVQFNRQWLSIVSFDIETKFDNGFPSPYIADQEITLITFRKNGKAWMLGCKPYTPKSDDVKFVLCKDEKDLLIKLIQVWKFLDPDIVTGWNILGFDIPYIINRIINIHGEDKAKELSPWNIIETREYATKWGDTQKEYTIEGLTCLDYMDLYKKFGKKQESYSLSHVSLMELNEDKVDYSEYGNLDDLYRKNWDLYCDYNLQDTILVDRLDKKLGFINIILSLAYMYKCNYADSLATVKPWDVFVHHYLLDRGIVIPRSKQSIANRDLVGGYVIDPIPGMYDYVSSFDIKSSYPHQIIQYNISPETLIGRYEHNISHDMILNGQYPNKQYLQNKNVSLAGNFVMFSNEKPGFFSEIMKEVFAERKKTNDKLSEVEAHITQVKDKLKTL